MLERTAIAKFYPYVPAVLILVVTTVFFRLYPQFFVVGLDALWHGDFEQDRELRPGSNRDVGATTGPWTGWNEHVTRDPQGGYQGSCGVRLNASGRNRGASLRCLLPAPRAHEYLRVSGWLRAEGVFRGAKPWHTAKLLLVFRDSRGRAHWDYPHCVGTIEGTTRWKHYKQVFAVPTWAQIAHVHLEQAADKGTLRADEVSVVPLALNPAFPQWQLVFLLLYLATAGYYAVRLVLWRRRHGLLILCVSVGITLGALCPVQFFYSAVESAKRAVTSVAGRRAEGRPSTSRPIAESASGDAVRTGGPSAEKEQSLGKLDSRWREVAVLKRLGHVGAFAYLAVLVLLSAPDVGKRRGARHRNLLFPLAAVIFFSVATELAQFCSVDRHPLLTDWLVDFGGVLLGMTFVTLHKFGRRAGSGTSGRARRCASRRCLPG